MSHFFPDKQNSEILFIQGSIQISTCEVTHGIVLGHLLLGTFLNGMPQIEHRKDQDGTILLRLTIGSCEEETSKYKYYRENAKTLQEWREPNKIDFDTNVPNI